MAEAQYIYPRNYQCWSPDCPHYMENVGIPFVRRVANAVIWPSDPTCDSCGQVMARTTP